MTIRRAWLAAFVALGMVTVYAAEVTNSTISGDPVAVDGGQVAGVVLSPQVHAYLGIPYAAPPVRDLRWRAPQPVIPWKGVLHAERPSPACMQRRQSYMGNGYTGEEALSEDCLYSERLDAGRRPRWPKAASHRVHLRRWFHRRVGEPW